AYAAGGTGGASISYNPYYVSPGGAGGDATATANSAALAGGTAMATANAFGGAGGASVFGGDGAQGAANATSSARTQKGGMAVAQSNAAGSSGQTLSTAQTGFAFVKVGANAQVGYAGSTIAITQGGGSGEAFVNPGQSAYAFTVSLPDKGYAASLIGGAGNVASALLGPRDVVFGASILGTNGGGQTSATFDFNYHGDLLLGLIDDQPSVSGEFTIVANGVTSLDQTFTDPSIADSFFQDHVIDLGSFSGPAVDLTIGYNGGFGAFDFAVGGAVPEASTWAMMLLGFMGLGFAGWRRAHAGARSIA
ncbi:MAG: PEP-CTERM sorting domain-containing protein, partial [Roseiarcus sp.]